MNNNLITQAPGLRKKNLLTDSIHKILQSLTFLILAYSSCQTKKCNPGHGKFSKHVIIETCDYFYKSKPL